ncbi:MAG: AraC family transcriptional regulator, partial [Chitinophagaceae bacterium]
KRRSDFKNVAVCNFYIGKSLLKLQQPDAAMENFRSVDSSFTVNNYLRPDLREAYELLISHHAKTGERDQELYYVRRLLKVDSVLMRDYKYLSGKIRKELDTRALLRFQETLEQEIEQRDYIDAALVGVFALTVAALIRRQLRIRRRYHAKYEEWQQAIAAPIPALAEPSTQRTADFDISMDIVTPALKRLAKMEKDRKFLAKDMDLSKLAKIMDVNMKYASRIILEYRKKGVIEYIRDLRIAYVVGMLKTDKNFRKYTDQALAAEAGFGSTQNFTRAFKTVMEMPPRFFIAQLLKTNENSSTCDLTSI